MTHKLSKPQQALYDQLKQGRKFATYNAHHMNGGQFHFVDNGELVRYKVFHNMQRALGADRFKWDEVHAGEFNHPR